MVGKHLTNLDRICKLYLPTIEGKQMNMSDRLVSLEDRVERMEKYIEQNKQNITGMYVGRHDLERKWKKQVWVRWSLLVVFNAFILIALYMRG